MLAASTATWVFILVPLIVVWVLGVADIVRRRNLDRSAKAGWILIVVLLPIVGTIVYWVMRKPSDEEIREAQAASEDLEGEWPGVKQRLPGD
jgi:Phospholipase_D-nuclease N-terminal